MYASSVHVLSEDQENLEIHLQHIDTALYSYKDIYLSVFFYSIWYYSSIKQGKGALKKNISFCAGIGLKKSAPKKYRLCDSMDSGGI